MRGAGRVAFAGIMLLMIGVLNVIYGIGALDNANIFVNDTRFILSDLNALGWVLIVLGAFQFIAGISLLGGQTFGRIFGVIAGTIGAVGALFSMGGAYPWWNLAIFFICIWVVWGILVFGEDEDAIA